MTAGCDRNKRHRADPERNVLTIPAQLLTAETKAVSIIAYAVPVENVEETEPTDAAEN